MESPTPFPPQWSTQQAVPVGYMRQFRYLARMFDRCHAVEGDVVECGLGEGNTFSMLAYFTATEGLPAPRVVWGFDSFQGWPQPSSLDESPRHPQQGEWRVSEEQVRQRLTDSKITETFPNLDIRITGGFLRDTLPSFPDRPIAFLHIDVDLYEGYYDALTHLFPKVAQGGLVLFDEYKEYHPEDPNYGNQEKWPGATRAIDEYFASLPVRYEIQYYEETKKYYVVKQ